MQKDRIKLVLLGFSLFIFNTTFSQVTERERPQKWQQLIHGARFIDRFEPMKGKELTTNTWGAKCVLPRYIDNGIEDRIWSYWGGNIKKGDDGMYHLLVCGWLESSEKGHMEWFNSYVFNAICDNPVGPFKLRNMIGPGHNPEVFQLKDGRYVLYVIDGRYVTEDINGAWEYGKFDFDQRDRKIIEGLSNLSFAEREDGSYIMVCRGGGIWISKTGLSIYNQLTDERVYPDVDGRFEDPVIWKDHIQYHMIVNDWLGRIAFYLRSKDGINWVVDPGEAYMPGIAVHESGLVEDWFKFERIKMLQDEHGRAIQANFAVIDTLKFEDKSYDNHSSKNIGIPLNPGLLLTLLDSKPITSKTKTIRLKIQAEEGFNPQTEVDLESLRFGASEEVNYGKGCKAISSNLDGKDLIVTFDAQGNGICEDEFAPKLIGKMTNGKLLYGYARLPYIDYIEPILSARAPLFKKVNKKWISNIEVENFGQATSQKASIKIECKKGDKIITISEANIPVLEPYNKIELTINNNENEEYKIIVTIHMGEKTFGSYYKQKNLTRMKVNRIIHHNNIIWDQKLILL